MSSHGRGEDRAEKFLVTHPSKAMPLNFGRPYVYRSKRKRTRKQQLARGTSLWCTRAGAVSYRLSCISSAQRGITPRVANECPILHCFACGKEGKVRIFFSFIFIFIPGLASRVWVAVYVPHLTTEFCRRGSFPVARTNQPRSFWRIMKSPSLCCCQN